MSDRVEVNRYRAQGVACIVLVGAAAPIDRVNAVDATRVSNSEVVVVGPAKADGVGPRAVLDAVGLRAAGVVIVAGTEIGSAHYYAGVYNDIFSLAAVYLVYRSGIREVVVSLFEVNAEAIVFELTILSFPAPT